MHDFKVIACDTDSVFFKKKDEAEFTEVEAEKLMSELNSLYPKNIKWELNGIYKKQITAKAKNYILFDGHKIKTKGSALKASTKERALKEFIDEIVQAILNDNTNYTDIYNKYVKETGNITDIKRWVSRKTISSKTLSSERTNESKIRDAIAGSDYREGDRCYLYFTKDKTLKLVEHFENDHDRIILLKKLHDTAKIFSTVLDVKNLFLNYSLKKNQELLK